MIEYVKTAMKMGRYFVKLHELIQLAAQSKGQMSSMDQKQAMALLQRLGVDPQNLYQELEMTSRFVDTHRDVSQPSEQVQLHSHTFYELLYVRSSGGVQYLVGTERYLLQRGDVVFVRPGVGHRPLLTDQLSEPYQRDVIWLSREFVEGMATLFFPDTPPDFPCLLRTAGTPWEQLLGDRFRLGAREAELQEPGWEAVVMGNTIQLMVLLSRASAGRRGETRHAETPSLLEEVLAYVERHLSQRITLPSVAQRFWVSESRISQIFREQMGVSFHRFVTQRRLIAAKNHIAEGMPLEEISTLVGFQDYSAFYRAFRQAFGISPRQYRKHLEQDVASGLSGANFALYRKNGSDYNISR